MSIPKDTVRFSAILVAGGQGLRAGFPMPKQFMPLCGTPMLLWSVKAFDSHPGCQTIYVVVPAAEQAACAKLLAEYDVALVAGGDTRQASVRAALDAIQADRGDDDTADDIVLVHDAARPGVSHAVIDAVLVGCTAPGHSGATPALPVADTLAMRDAARSGVMADGVPRDAMVRIQTPQGFYLSALQAAHERWSGDAATDDAQMVRASGGVIALVSGNASLDKITTAEDFERMALLLSPAKRTAVGSGYDVHRLVPGDGVWLGGVFIPHDRRLDGHSDADVLLHAITDALLGTIGAGDIGAHFPPSDPQWRGASSDRFLVHAGSMVGAAGGQIEHIDCTLICEAPKVGPHRDAIARRIAELLGVPVDHVSVKATTTERLGFTGRQEGIAAQATATVRLPLARGNDA